MSNNKHLKITVVTVSMFLNICITVSVCAKDIGNYKWTKEEVDKIIRFSVFNQPPADDQMMEDIIKLRNNVDTASKILINRLKEETWPYTISHIFSFMMCTKNKHDLFANAISNKLKSYQSDSEHDMEIVNWSAARALERIKQSRESINTNTFAESTNHTKHKLWFWFFAFPLVAGIVWYLRKKKSKTKI